MQNRSLLQKAELAVADMAGRGGLLSPAQAHTFIKELTKASELLPRVTLLSMESPKQEFAKISMGQRVLRPAKEAQALSSEDYARPEFGKVELDAKSFKAEVHLTDESLEDNIEGPALESRIRELLSDGVARDMEELAIAGDTKSDDSFFATMDGLLVQASEHVVAAQGAPISKDLLSTMLKIMPSAEKRNKKNMCFFTGVNAEQDYRSRLAERATAVGDRFLEGFSPIPAFGVPIVSIPLLPEERGRNHDETHVVLCDPKNIFLGIWRKIRIESDRDISRGILKIVVSMRFDVRVAEPRATSQAVGIGPVHEYLPTGLVA